MGIKRVMTGAPWHVEKMVRKEGDPRRHRSRCIYYNKSTGHCPKVVSKCVGAAHCNYYEECRVDETEPIHVNVVMDKSDFQGVKMIAMSDIEVSNKFKLPAQDKIDAVIQYYRKNGKLDKPISVSCHGKKYKLEDKYLRYYVAQQLGLKEVPARISTEKENKLEDKIRIVGTRVKHTKYGNGKIVNVTDKNVDILFETGKAVSFNIDMCVKKIFISVI